MEWDELKEKIDKSYYSSLDKYKKMWNDYENK